MKSARQNGRKAWLVTWEWSGDHAQREQKVAAVFRPQLSGKRVRELVECLYSFSEYTPRERMAFGLGLSPNPYPARFGTLDSISWEGVITCGHNPWLEARLVDDLVIDENDQPNYTPRKRPTLPAGWNA